MTLHPLADAEPGRPGRRRRRRELQHRARRPRTPVGCRAGAATATTASILMVELGDLREGILPGDLEAVARPTLELPNLVAARHRHQPRVPERRGARSRGTWPSSRRSPASIETTFGVTFDIVSGGNSANLDWAFGGADVGRDQRPAARRVDPARPRAAPTGIRSTACTPTRSRSSPRSSSRRRSRRSRGARSTRPPSGSSRAAEDRGTTTRVDPRGRSPGRRSRRSHPARGDRDPRRQQRPPRGRCGNGEATRGGNRDPIPGRLQRPGPSDDVTVRRSGVHRRCDPPFALTRHSPPPATPRATLPSL